MINGKSNTALENPDVEEFEYDHWRKYDDQEKNCAVCHWIESFSLLGIFFPNLFGKQSSMDQEGTQRLRNSSFDSYVSDTRPKKSHTPGKVAAVEDFILIVKSGMMKAKMSKTDSFQKLSMDDEYLLLKDSKGFVQDRLKLTEITQVINSAERSNPKYLTIILTKDDHSEQSIQLEFERAQETKAFGRGLRKMVRARAREGHLTSFSSLTGEDETKPHSLAFAS